MQKTVKVSSLFGLLALVALTSTIVFGLRACCTGGDFIVTYPEDCRLLNYPSDNILRLQGGWHTFVFERGGKLYSHTFWISFQNTDSMGVSIRNQDLQPIQVRDTKPGEQAQATASQWKKRY
jgi:hypothetical protein